VPFRNGVKKRWQAKGVALIEGLWSRYFPAVEHARAAVELGRKSINIVGDGWFGVWHVGFNACKEHLTY